MNDTITVTGENLGKSAVSAVFLSDDKNDYKATIVEQSDAKIVAKIPRVKPGEYNVSVQTGSQIMIEPCASKWSNKPGATPARLKELPTRSKNRFRNFGTPWSGAVQSSDSYPQLFGNGPPAKPLASQSS